MSTCRDVSSHRPQAVRARRRDACDEEDKILQDTTLFRQTSHGSESVRSFLVAPVRHRRRKLPKEVVFAIGVVTTALQGGGLIFGFSAFADQITKLHGSSYTTSNVTSIFSVGHNITAWGCILSGLILDRFGPRICAASGLVIEAVGHFIMTQVVYWPEIVIYIGYGLIGLGGCQVLLAALGFVDAFQHSASASAVLTSSFQAGGFVFMILPFVPWVLFFQVYAVSCLVSAALLLCVYPDSPMPPFRPNVEHSDVAEISAAMASNRTLKQVLLRPGTIGFMLTFMIAGSALVYGSGEFIAAVQDKDQCDWDSSATEFTNCKSQATQNLLNQVMMPLVGNFILPVSLVLGWLIDKTGFTFPAFINIFFVQVFIVALWLFPLDAQYGTLAIYNVANTAVFTVQNAYICSVGHDHIGALFSISNAVMGFGNLLSDFFSNNPFGTGKDAIHTSVMISSITWLVMCTPLYYWVVVEFKRARRKKAGIDSFALSTCRSASASSQIADATEAKPEHFRSNLSALSGSVLSSVGPDTTPRLSWNPVLTVNPLAWDAKVANAVKAGAGNVFWVCDFDRTVTRCFLDDGRRSLDCHDILASIPKITRDCKQHMEDMMEYYYPIEIHPTMTREEKIPFMVEWYRKVNAALGSQNLSRDDVAAAVRNCQGFLIRSGVEEAFTIARQKGIPIIILSAGLGNIIEEVIRQRIMQSIPEVEGQLWPNIKILSNSLFWDESGNCSGFSEPLIHMYNKSLQDAPEDLRKLIEGRSIAMLSGDGTGDLTMANGHSTTDVLKLGFLNERIEERMHLYVAPDAYDRVILNDGSFEAILEVLRRL